jgi:hypothetical protein
MIGAGIICLDQPPAFGSGRGKSTFYGAGVGFVLGRRRCQSGSSLRDICWLAMIDRFAIEMPRLRSANLMLRIEPKLKAVAQRAAADDRRSPASLVEMRCWITFVRRAICGRNEPRGDADTLPGEACRQPPNTHTHAEAPTLN